MQKSFLSFFFLSKISKVFTSICECFILNETTENKIHGDVQSSFPARNNKKNNKNFGFSNFTLKCKMMIFI